MVVALCQAPEVARKSDSQPRLCTRRVPAHHIHIPAAFPLLGLPLVSCRPSGAAPLCHGKCALRASSHVWTRISMLDASPALRGGEQLLVLVWAWKGGTERPEQRGICRAKRGVGSALTCSPPQSPGENPQCQAEQKPLWSSQRAAFRVSKRNAVQSPRWRSSTRKEGCLPQRHKPCAWVAVALKVSSCQITESQTVRDWKGPQDEACGHGAGPASSSSGSACQEHRSQALLGLSAAQRACTIQPHHAWLLQSQAQPHRSAQVFGNLCDKLRASKPRAYKI